MITGWKTSLALCAAILVLNGLLTLHGVWPSFGVRPSLEVSTELAALLLAACLLAAARGGLSPPWRRGLLACLLILIVGRYPAVTAPVVFGRDINLYWDLRHLPSVAAMMAASVPTGWILVLAVLALLALGLTALVVLACVRALSAALARPILRRRTAAGAALVLGIHAAAVILDWTAVQRWFATPVTPVYARQVAVAWHAVMDAPEDFASTGGEERPNPDALCGGDLILFFVESYGATVFDNPVLRQALAPRYAELSATLASRGLHAASARLLSPTFGGVSWLAHATLLMGVQVENAGLYERLLASGRSGLPAAMKAMGYRTVALFPGIRSRWTEGEAYGFDTIYDAAAIGYGGPAYGWWTIPDQVSVEFLYRRELRASERPPVFAVGAGIMSHLPFQPVPPYRPDWSTVTDPDAFPAPPVEAGIDLREAYRRSIEYELRTLNGFIAERLPADAVLVILGDHQPLRAVSGEQASAAVPAHVIAGRRDLLAPFLAAGYADGLLPDRTDAGPMVGLHDRLTTLLAEDSGCGPS